MKKVSMLLIIVSLFISKQLIAQDMNHLIDDAVAGVFPQGVRAPADKFTGTVWVQSLVNPADAGSLYSVGQVTFEPGGKTNWHTHPAGQVLLVTGGKGWYQERGNHPVSLKKGDVYIIPKDMEHWHGATKDTKFVHIAISNVLDGNSATWLLPVTGEEYGVMPE